MQRIRVCFLILLGLGLATVARAENSLAASAEDAGCGDIAVSGTVQYDPCQDTIEGDQIKVEVWEEGRKVTSFTVTIGNSCMGMFNGQSSGLGLSPGTYTVLTTVTITNSSGTNDYAYRFPDVNVN